MSEGFSGSGMEQCSSPSLSLCLSLSTLMLSQPHTHSHTPPYPLLWSVLSTLTMLF